MLVCKSAVNICQSVLSVRAHAAPSQAQKFSLWKMNFVCLTSLFEAWLLRSLDILQVLLITLANTGGPQTKTPILLPVFSLEILEKVIGQSGRPKKHGAGWYVPAYASKPSSSCWIIWATCKVPVFYRPGRLSAWARWGFWRCNVWLSAGQGNFNEKLSSVFYEDPFGMPDFQESSMLLQMVSSFPFELSLFFNCDCYIYIWLCWP